MESSTKKVSRLKVISFGNVETGKSCLIKRYCEKRFVSKYMPTVGVDFGVTKVTFNERKLKINLFDLSGHPAFFEVRNEFYKDTQAALLVYDVTCKASFDALDSWLKEFKEYVKEPLELDSIIFMLCANKIDKENRIVDRNQGECWAEKNGFYYMETSALSDEGINKVFQLMFKALLDVIDTGKRPRSAKGVLGYNKEQLAAINQLNYAKDNYDCLGLSYGASREEINKSYRKMAKLLHPDKCFGSESSDAFKILGAARDHLLKVVK